MNVGVNWIFGDFGVRGLVCKVMSVLYLLVGVGGGEKMQKVKNPPLILYIVYTPLNYTLYIVYYSLDTIIIV